MPLTYPAARLVGQIRTRITARERCGSARASSDQMQAVEILTRRAERPADGAAAVEFALVAPLFIILVFGVISFGIVFAQNLALDNGAREAARSGVVENRTCAQIRTSAKDAASSIAMQGTDVTVSIKRGQSAATAVNACASDTVTPCTGSAAGDSIYVRLDFTSRLIVPLAIVKDSFPLSGSGVFRCEYS